jgi:hypothetical protein
VKRAMPLSIPKEEQLLLLVESVAVNIELMRQLPEGDRPERELAALKDLIDGLSENVLSGAQARARIRLRLLLLRAKERELRDAVNKPPWS